MNRANSIFIKIFSTIKMLHNILFHFFFRTFFGLNDITLYMRMKFLLSSLSVKWLAVYVKYMDDFKALKANS